MAVDEEPVTRKRRSRAEAEAYWRAHVRAWRSSGLSQSAFCRRERLCVEVFGRWKRLIENVRAPASMRSRLKRGRRAAVFVPVRVREAALPASGAAGPGVVELALRNGRVMRLPAAMGAAEAARWAGVLEAPPC